MKPIKKEQIDNIINYYNEFKLNIENGYRFRVNDLEKKHKVKQHLNSYLRDLNIITFNKSGNGTKYVFNVGIMEPILARKVIIKIREDMIRKNIKYKKSITPKSIPLKKQPTKQITKRKAKKTSVKLVYLFGILILKIINQ
jgi:hypothetical protein